MADALAASRPKHSLRNYLIAYFIPLTGVPLLVLAGLTYFLLGTAVDQEILRRSSAELATVSRNLDTVEKKVRKKLAELARDDEVQVGLLAREGGELGRVFRGWLPSSYVESIKAYTVSGALIASAEQKDSKRFQESWNNFFGPRPLRPAGAESRDPSSVKSSNTGSFNPDSRYTNRNRNALSRDFARFIRGEDSWSYKEVNPRGSVFENDHPVLELVIYKLVVDSDFKPAGYLEAHVALDDYKLRILSQHQGVDVALVSPGFRLLGSSSPSVETKFSSQLPELRNQKQRDLRALSREMYIDSQPVEFFFAPIANEGSDPIAWISVGLYKGTQVRLRQQIMIWIVSMATALALLTVILTLRISRRITQPIANLVDAAEAVKMGEWVQPVEADSKTEIGFLVRRFNEMAQSVGATKRMLEFKLEELATAHSALTQTQGQLVQSAKLSSLGQLVAGVAHELNNPIAFIYSNMSQMRLYLEQIEQVASSIERAKAKLDPAAARELDRVLNEAEWDFVRKDMGEMIQSCLEGSIRVKDIVLGLRSFSRPDKGEIMEADINTALRNTVKLLASQIKNRVNLHWDLCEGAVLKCNVAQINQVFMNLIANALQAIDGRGNVWIRTELSHLPGSRTDGGVEMPADLLTISIRDDGKGIKPEAVDKIFDPFFTTKKVGEGTGLGLSIVYGIIERHHGNIQVRSIPAPAPEHGTEFIVTLPLQGGIDSSLSQAS